MEDRKTWSRYYTAAIASAVGLVCYLNTLQADFVYDDSRAIQNNSDLLSTTPWVNLLNDDFWGTPLTHSGSHKSYRPLCVASFRLNYAVHGLNPMGYHLINAMLHSVVCLLVVMLCDVLMLSHRASMIGGLLFATHPVHTEAVAGLVGRADVGACMFFLAALLTYIKSCPSHNIGIPENENLSKCCRTNWGLLLVSLAISAASMLTKEQGITVLGVCAVYEAIVVSRINFRAIKVSLKKAISIGFLPRILSLVFTAISLLSLRFVLMGNKTPDFSNSDNPAANSKSFLTRTFTFLYLPAFNFWLLLCPITLSFDWSMNAIPLVQGIFDWRNIVSLVFYSGFAMLGVITLNRLSLENFDWLFSEMNANYKGLDSAYFRMYDVMNRNEGVRKRNVPRPKQDAKSSPKERRKTPDTKFQTNTPDEYISTIHDCQSLLVSMAILALPFVPATNIFFYVGFVVAERVLYIPSVGYCIMVAVGLDLLWRCCSDSRKKNCITGSLCIVLLLFSIKTVHRNQDWKDGETLYRSGIDVNPAKAWANLGTILSSRGQQAEAEHAYRKALSYRSNMADTHYNLGVLLADQKRYEDAIRCYEYAVSYRPALALAHLNLGIALEKLGRRDDAITVLKNATTISGHGLKDPKGHASAAYKIKYNLGRILTDMDRLDEAFAIYHDAVRTLPDHVEPHSLYNMIGEAYSKAGMKQEAEKWYKNSLLSKPDHVPAHLTLAKLFSKMDRKQEAIQQFKKAQQIQPQDHSVWTHYGQFLYEERDIVGAADMFIKASQVKPDDFDIVFTAANYLREAGKNKHAKIYFIKAAKINPLNPVAHMNLGAIHHVLGEYAEGEKSYLAALRLKPGDKMTQDNLRKLRSLSSRKNKV